MLSRAQGLVPKTGINYNPLKDFPLFLNLELAYLCLSSHFSLSCIGEGNGNQCSCLENPRDGGAWWAAVYGVAQSRTRWKWLSCSSSSWVWSDSIISPRTYLKSIVGFHFALNHLFCCYALWVVLGIMCVCVCVCVFNLVLGIDNWASGYLSWIYALKMWYRFIALRSGIYPTVVLGLPMPKSSGELFNCGISWPFPDRLIKVSWSEL